ncbi:hypothetical protein TSOC_000902 [Tetrabaena socialis]|uniref:Uncharacterized protein n=1 Tax=Tetrabaena socialis TaxID=47790 RepID=A0A2J8AI48_9CHLO|nr:hypothetical protein TSOC_000902 [Tetrabaena socialis]|eukprot:PNH12199.1 hypothetical protein TSOC_000902 [Tetrabaena socialis]
MGERAAAAAEGEEVSAEVEAEAEYFGKERASVTATTVFTWGNRYKIGASGSGRVVGAGGGSGGGGNGVAEPATFHSYTPAQHKPPLRL